MERVYVVEQSLTCASEPFQLKFAEEAARLLQPIRGVLPRPTGKALLLLGTCESALDPALAVLGTRYGEDLRASGRRVRYLDDPPMEPIMDVFVRVPAEHGERVRRDLERRRGVLRFKLVEPRGWLMRAEVPMAELMRYGADLARMTEDRAEHWISFNRWEPIEDDGGRAA
ncbi:MAG TPA: hypothetical protein VIL43_13770 [Burkholderiales bacterium]